MKDAYSLILTAIESGTYRPGDRLVESELAERFGVSRTPVREALQRLASEGLVVVLPRRGILVSEINISRHLQLLEIRRVLERFVAQTAARRASAAERAEFRQLAEAFGRSADEDDPVTFMRLDRRFNRLSVEASHNDYAANAMRQIQGLSRRFWYRHYENVLDLPRCARLHQAVAVAIADAEPETAGAASDALLDYIEEFARLTI